MNRQQKSIALVLFGLVGTYLVLRAIYMPLIHDEIATFFRYVHLGTFIPYHSEWSTNNHILNSAFTWLSYKLLGHSPIAQRLPNLLFIPIYFYFIYKISGKLQNTYLKWGFIIVLLTIHNYMDFFCLSRGYGMSLAMLTGSIWFTWRTFETDKIDHYLLSLIFMLLAVSAILILVNSYIIIIILLAIRVVQKNAGRTSRMVKLFTLLLFLGIIPVAGVVKYLLDLNDVGRLDYGGMDGFWNVSVRNLTNFLVGPLSPILNTLIIVFFSAMVVGFIILIFRETINNWISRLLKPEHLFFYLLTGNLLGFWLEHQLFGILYPEERTSIQFILFFVGGLIFLLDKIKLQKQYIPALALIPFAFFPVQFIYSLNFESSPIDTFNYNIPERFYDKVSAAHRSGKFPPTVEGYQLRTMKWNWYNFIKKSEESSIHFNGYPGLDGDFQVVIPEEYPQWFKYYDVADVDKNGNMHLLERKNKLKRHLIYTKGDIQSEGVFKGEYFNLAEGPVDTLTHSTLYFGFTLNLESEQRPFHGNLVITIFDIDRQPLRYEYIPLTWYRTDFSDPENTFMNGQLVHDLPVDSHSFVAYIWNIYSHEFRVTDTSVSIYKLVRDYR